MNNDFSSIDKENIFTVSEVTLHLKNVLESNIPAMTVIGEVSNLSQPFSGHLYFSLKDENSILKCVCFKSAMFGQSFVPRNGDKIICLGKITVYEKAGYYQLMVQKIFPAGIGLLQMQFEELKKKLSQEGLFDSDRKRALPKYPQKIGIITSATGAAYQDIKNILTRRYPCDIYLYPALVQGQDAVGELMAGLDYFNQVFAVDVIIIGRGGGSYEDLFCFNDEQLARKIAFSKTPVISAVGHEIDFTIADFVADLRAPTPSAAAELAVPDKIEILRNLDNYYQRIRLLTLKNAHYRKQILGVWDKKLQMHHPLRKMYQFQQRLDEAYFKLQAPNVLLTASKKKIQLQKEKLLDLIQMQTLNQTKTLNNRIIEINHTLKELTKEKLTDYRNKLKTKENELNEFSPRNTLKRGYAIARMKSRLVKTVRQINKGDLLNLDLIDGTLNCEVKEIEPK